MTTTTLSRYTREYLLLDAVSSYSDGSQVANVNIAVGDAIRAVAQQVENEPTAQFVDLVVRDDGEGNVRATARMSY